MGQLSLPSLRVSIVLQPLQTADVYGRDGKNVRAPKTEERRPFSKFIKAFTPGGGDGGGGRRGWRSRLENGEGKGATDGLRDIFLPKEEGLSLTPTPSPFAEMSLAVGLYTLYDNRRKGISSL